LEVIPVSAIDRALTLDVPQTEPLDDRQSPNHGGGYSYTVDEWTRLRRWLILGTDGGSYYQGERDLTRENLKVVSDALTADAERALGEAVAVSRGGLAKRNDQALYLVAAGLAHADEKTRQAAALALPEIARTGTHLFQVAEWHKALSERGGVGWGTVARRAFSNTLGQLGTDRLALHMVKYRQRHGWTYRDILRKAHPDHTALGADRVALYEWACGRDLGDLAGHLPAIVRAYEAAQKATSVQELIPLITGDPGLPWEAIPSELLPGAWGHLIDAGMPIGALTRNLSTFVRRGALNPLDDRERLVVASLTSPEKIRAARMHPVAFLDAMLVHADGGTGDNYPSGWGSYHGAARGRTSLSRGGPFAPNQAVLGALDEAFRLAFQAVTPAQKRFYLAVDVSDSMTWTACAGSAIITPRQGAAAQALVTASTEPRVHVAAFSRGMVPVTVRSNMGIREAVDMFGRVQAGPTDCAAPMVDAAQRRIPVDCFVVYTDNETNVGRVHPMHALRQYRKTMDIPAKLVVVGMTATNFSIADPADGGCLDLAGFDASTPAVISRFAAGMI
jgi:60 kDa SS-A/Ro ribonucleoprotein